MRDVSNPTRHADVDRVKAELESELRVQFKDRSELKLWEPVRPYQTYYKKFD